MEKKYLYGLTVQGIQSYIFETNTLKEIIGGSEIVEQMCTTWFDNFLDEKKIKGERYLNAAGNIRFKADKEGVQTIFKEYHLKLLQDAPGVPFSQAVVEIDNPSDAIDLLDRKLRAQRNSPLYDFDLGIMTRAKNRRTGNFAVEVKYKNEDYPDAITKSKLSNSDVTALQEKTEITGVKYPIKFEEIAKGGKHHWLALMHIDGNGMGNRIAEIKEKAGDDAFNQLKNFSINVNKSTIASFQKAISKIRTLINTNGKTEELPIRPIVLGGDDVTVIIRADLAIVFAETFLSNFEEETKKKLGEEKGLTAAAGIAFVKEKFPFHYSAELAEELCSYAKNKSKRENSCLHFHRVQDSFIDGYQDIIKRELKVNNQFEFLAGPYYINENNGHPRVKELLDEVKLLQNDDAPTNGMREWIDAKFHNPGMAETIKKRIQNKSKSKYNEVINKEESYMDYHTLIAVNTKS